MQDFESQLETSREQSRLSKEHCGEDSKEYAVALYFEAKSLNYQQLTKSMAFTVVKKSISVWKKIPATQGVQDLGHAQALLLKATLLAQTMKKYRWAVKVYHKAAIILSEIKEPRVNLD